MLIELTQAEWRALLMARMLELKRLKTTSIPEQANKQTELAKLELLATATAITIAR